MGIPFNDVGSFTRAGRAGNPTLALQNVALIIKRSRRWQILGGMTIAAGYLILT
ncbi:hypothetical protein [Coxiella endosymbiont of Ornithodoros maritimus]|uniref:hypothetical protein n=1 Tax=Coxiella endosymbiont of Ornithodoros maritimus TaxID=1656172 RepID=UPI002264C02E|nr:hypothetical protein [Coxiella endosymbiont of Ornithodoros maritimus]